MIKGEDIKRLIPQREPFIMVDEFEEYDDNSAGTVLNVCPDNYFILPDGTMAETGLIEHLAQSCSALAPGIRIIITEHKIVYNAIKRKNRFILFAKQAKPALPSTVKMRKLQQ